MGIKQALESFIPAAYYENGQESKCMIFKICNLFDVDSASYGVMIPKDTITNKKEITDIIWGPEINAKTGKLV